MSIAALKVNEEAFYDIYSLLEEFDWLKEKVNALLELWNLCEEREQQELLKLLFSRFTYIPLNDRKELTKSIVNKIEKNWNFTSENTYIAAISDSDEVDGSTANLYSFKTHLSSSWQENNLVPTIAKIKYTLKEAYKSNLILFDDFIGSGKTLSRKIKWLEEELANEKITLENIKIVAYAGMSFGIKKITNEINSVEIFTPNILKKGISDFESDEKLIQQQLKIMISIEQKLKAKVKGLNLNVHSLGYAQSETLYQLEDSNCSNNVFPIFWWPYLKGGNERKTIFRRIR